MTLERDFKERCGNFKWKCQSETDNVYQLNSLFPGK